MPVTFHHELRHHRRYRQPNERAQLWLMKRSLRREQWLTMDIHHRLRLLEFHRHHRLKRSSAIQICEAILSWLPRERLAYLLLHPVVRLDRTLHGFSGHLGGRVKPFHWRVGKLPLHRPASNCGE